MEPAPPTWRDRLAVVAFTGTLLTMAALGLPELPATDEAGGKDLDLVVGEVSSALTTIGVRAPPEDLEATYLVMAAPYDRIRRWAYEPVREWVVPWIGMRQRWQMFVVLRRVDRTFTIQADFGAGWVDVPRPSWLSQTDMRGLIATWARRGRRKPARQLSEWLLPELRDAHPEARRFRTRWRRVDVGQPGETYEPIAVLRW